MCREWRKQQGYGSVRSRASCKSRPLASVSLFRAAASFIKALLRQSGRALLIPSEMKMEDSGGALIVVGSHVPRTTVQLNHLLKSSDAVGIEANVAQLLSEGTRQAEIDRAARAAEKALHAGNNAVIYTSRTFVGGNSPDHSLAIGHQTSQATLRDSRRHRCTAALHYR